jgi:hypothetical protein
MSARVGEPLKAARDGAFFTASCAEGAVHAPLSCCVTKYKTPALMQLFGRGGGLGESLVFVANWAIPGSIPLFMTQQD